MTSHQTLAACLAWGRQHDDKDIRRDAGRLEKLCSWRRLSPSDLAKTPADIRYYLADIAPRFDRSDARLARDLDGQFKADTYQQYQRSGRRLIDLFTGEAHAAAARRARSDAWADLMTLLDRLATAGLVSRGRFRSLKVLADVARRVGLLPKDITPDQLHALRAALRHVSEWDRVLKALRFLDTLRVHAILNENLPPVPFGKVETSWRRVFIIPQPVSDMIDAWVDRAGREQIDDPRFKRLAQPLSDDARARFRSVLRNFVYTSEEIGEARLAEIDDLYQLFSTSIIDATIGHWIETSSDPGGLSIRSIADYSFDLVIILARNGVSEQASYLHGLRKAHHDIKKGDDLGETMSAKNKTWCRRLLTDERKIEIFDTQHILYWEEAKAALAEARAAGLDLKGLMASNRIETLPRKARSLAKRTVAKARRFGTCAAFAAIEIEGAPFRKTNTLDLNSGGPRATFFDNSQGPDPRFTIIIPNEQLKNGKALTKRGEELPPIDIRDVSPADHGFAILRWFIDEIRPLFPNFTQTNHLFPACDGQKARLATRTFDTWMFQCSNTVGLPLTPHNFRHGYVSIQYAVDRTCLGDLAILLGDAESTLRDHYQFIDAARTAREIQDSIRVRREARREAWRPVPMRRAA
jgi:hypothetical protein